MTDFNGLEVGGQVWDEGEREELDGDDPITFDCEYCEVVLEARTIDAMKERGTTHLETHKPTLFEIFADKSRGKQCQNECGYVFPVGGDQGTGFECPQCGYDNFEEFAHRYLYWQIEYPETRRTDFGRD